jgi:hypothetical protein
MKIAYAKRRSRNPNNENWTTINTTKEETPQNKKKTQVV